MQTARRFAQERHDEAGCVYAGESHVVHLDEVVAVLDEYEIEGEAIRIAAFLHDVIEDTPVTLADVLVNFGPEVAMLVFAVTDEPGKNRAERHERTYPKMIAVGETAVTLKLADRIANVRASARVKRGDLLKMYKKEWPEMKEQLWAIGDGRMKAELEKLLTE